jgi:hypothetical protein
MIFYIESTVRNKKKQEDGGKATISTEIFIDLTKFLIILIHAFININEYLFSLFTYFISHQENIYNYIINF